MKTTGDHLTENRKLADIQFELSCIGAKLLGIGHLISSDLSNHESIHAYEINRGIGMILTDLGTETTELSTQIEHILISQAGGKSE